MVARRGRSLFYPQERTWRDHCGMSEKCPTSGLIDNANKSVFQLTIQKRSRRIFAGRLERSTWVTHHKARRFLAIFEKPCVAHMARNFGL
jgi:hypothetical protein